MLTPVTPNPIATSTTIKTHGSEARTASSHNAIETQPVQPSTNHVAGIGMDAGTLLASVNAEAATAGNRTVLQTLALAVATQLNMVRRANETMDAFFLRIAAALDQMTPEQGAALEASSGLKLLKISLPELSAALRQPDSALAARLSAMAEAPLATPLKTAAQAATTSYLQEAPGTSRAAETLAMVTQLRSKSEGSGLFMSTTPPAQEGAATDARGLQSQLQSLFEPGVAEIRKELAERPALARAPVPVPGETPAGPSSPAPTQQNAQAGTLVPALASGPAEPAILTEEPQPQQAADTMPADGEAKADAEPVAARPVAPQRSEGGSAATMRTAVVTREQPVSSETRVFERPRETPPARTEPRILGLPLSQSNVNSSMSLRIRAIAQELVPDRPLVDEKVAGRQEDGERHMQTLLVLKGIAEAPAPAAGKADELPPEQKHANGVKAGVETDLVEANTDMQISADVQDGPDSVVFAAASRKDAEVDHHATAPTSDPAEDPRASVVARRDAVGEQNASARSPEQQNAMLARAATDALDPVPFAYAALQPAKDEFEAEALEDNGRQDADEDEAGDEDREDPEARRERLARKAVDDFLRPEPEEEPDLRITRDSSQADRAYALYQRMGGF